MRLEFLKRKVGTSDTQKYTCILTTKHLNKAVQPFCRKTCFQLLE